MTPEHIRTTVETFLQQRQNLVEIYKSAVHDSSALTKAGVVPFVKDATSQQMEFLLMKPQPKKPGLGLPPFQICKGTRMAFSNGEWVDMRENNLTIDLTIKEELIVTALREGIEELGLQLECIEQIIDVGPFDFASATSGSNKRMWLFALKMRSQDMIPLQDIIATTAERQWQTLQGFEPISRPDHFEALKNIAGILQSK